MDKLDRQIINRLQSGFPICERPFKMVATWLNITEQTLLQRLEKLLEEGILSRFAPLYHAEKLGGGLTLAALAVPEHDFERVTNIVNSFPEIAHNYAREHDLNMWFVIATEKPERINEIIKEIEKQTALTVYNMPKQTEYYIGLYFEV
ncbi:MAG: hypothetical protein RIT27_757 [Pseudomonadota bacterium]|jgi:DNA-binding Lrp family transcriptional regulator